MNRTNDNIMKILDIQSSNSSDSNTTSKRSRRLILISVIELIVIIILVGYIIYIYNSLGRTVSEKSLAQDGPKQPIISTNESNVNSVSELSEGDSGITEISDDTTNNLNTKEKIFTIDGQSLPSLLELPIINENCDQRKYDLPFGVLCNNRQCPKFQFDWPKKKQELAIVTSTRAGLRFHKQIQMIKGPEFRISVKHRANGQSVTNNFANPSVISGQTTIVSQSQIKEELHYTMGEYEAFESSAINSRTALVINIKQKYQPIIGFGGAFSDSSSSVIMGLSMNMTKSLIEDYFGDNGIKYNMGRVTIGSSDFSTRFYTNDDLAPFNGPTRLAMPAIFQSPTASIVFPASQQQQQQQQQLSESQQVKINNTATTDTTDFELKRFKLVEEDYLYKIPLLKLAQTVSNLNNRELKLIASMWSPPLWMKTNNFYNKGYLKGSPQQQKQQPPTNQSSDQQVGADPGQYYETLAELKARFLEAYDRVGLKFWGLTVMNEPIMAIQPFIDFNTMLFPRNDYLAYIIKYLGPKMALRPNLNHIKLMVHDDNRKYLPMLADLVMANTSARQYISGIAVHGYIDVAYELMDELYEKYPGKFILSTELSSGHLPFMQKALIGNWHRGVHYMYDIMKTLQHSGSGWVDWNIALDLEGGPGWLGGRLDSPILVDKANDQYFKNPMYYALGHFSKFLDAGSVRLGMQLVNGNYDYHLDAVAFLTPNNYIVIVVLNNNPYEIPIDVRMLRSGTPQSSLATSPATTNINNDQLTITTVNIQAESFSTIVYMM